MHHLVILKKQWGLLEKILKGEKTIESRWYKSKRAPWDRIQAGDVLFLKNSGEAVTAKAEVYQVEQYEIMDGNPASILANYKLHDLGIKDIQEEIGNYIAEKKYAIFVHLINVERIPSFQINKSGYGMQAAWICVEDIRTLKIE